MPGTRGHSSAGSAEGSVPEELARRLAGARHIVALTGAGISAESGVPTFRDAQTGLWARFRPEDLATREAFEADPGSVWRWYQWRRALVREARPNAGHFALAGLGRRRRLTVVTQNVDGLHRAAGSDPIEYHGNLFDNLCLAEHLPVVGVAEPCDEPPRCPRCGSLVRPGVVWFGELIPSEALRRADAAITDCDLFLSIGTSSLVYPAAGLAETALRKGAFVVEVNPAPTPLSSHADCLLRGSAATVLPALLAVLAGAG